MKVKSESEVAQSYPTPSDPMDCSPPGSSTLGIFQARVLEWGAIAFFALRFTWGQTMVEVMKIMATFFKRSQALTDSLSAPDPAAGHH